jgi:hypothetical protein
MSPNLPTLALAALAAILPASSALAHCFVGNRFFPATLAVDDPCVADELSLPTVSRFRNDDNAWETGVSGEFSKRITDNFGISVGTSWARTRPPGGPTMSGFENLETSFKYQFLTDAARELVMSAAVEVEWAKTGSGGFGEPVTTTTPTFFIGKGFGGLPDSLQYLRPFALTGQVGYAVPSSSMSAGEINPRSLVYGGSLQYSMPYLKSSVVDLQLPDVFNRLIPLVEWSMQTQVSNFNGETRTTGIINPGLMWVGDTYQLSVEAILPINDASGRGTGVMGQLHFYLDDIFPTTLGQPIVRTSTLTTGRPFGN